MKRIRMSAWLWVGWLLLATVAKAEETIPDGPYVAVASSVISGFTPGASADVFPRAQGVYHGLIAAADDGPPSRSGSFRLSVWADRYFSGQMNVGGQIVPWRGTFSPQGLASVSIYKWIWDDCLCVRYFVHVWTLELALRAGTDEIEGTIRREYRTEWTSDLFGFRAGYGGTRMAPQAGRYTLRLPGSDDASVAPPGDGFAAVTVSARGAVRMGGRLPDGVSWSVSTALSTNGWWPVYVPLNGGDGMLFGWLRVSGTGATIVAGELSWIRTRGAGGLYPAGFSGTIPVSGGRYEPPSSGGLPLTWATGLLTVSAGDVFPPAVNEIRFEPRGRILDQGGDLLRLKLKLNARTGVFSGSFLHPQTARKTSLAGALFLFEDAGGGNFPGPSQGGRVRLEGGN